MDFQKARERAAKIVEPMTAYEKMSQLVYNSPAIERLGIKEYNWWNEAAHGVARAGVATVFPQAIGMAATFNTELVRTVADAVSTEARAKYNKSVQFNDYDIFKGLTYWTPNINIFRDPRWGRGQETYGEDPFLTASMGVSCIKGLQGDGEFLKSGACAKHYAVHSGPEKLRHGFDAIASKKDMFETYLPAFEHAVKNGVAGVMGAYNRTNSEPCCAHSFLMEDVLFDRWNFEGYFVSDCGAINDIYEHHKFKETKKETAAIALERGCHLNCGEAYAHLIEAYEEDLITDEAIDEAVLRLFTIRVLLGEFEEVRPYSDVSYDKLDCPEHRALNLEASKQTMVLLKNEDNFLPIKENTFKKIAVVGPNANSTVVLEGNYFGNASEHITVAEGMRRMFPEARVTVATGTRLYIEKKNDWDGFGYMRSEGLAAASEADFTLVCLGMDRTIEGEQIEGLEDDCLDSGDKKNVHLPKAQVQLCEEICDVCDNVAVVVMCGSPVDLGKKINSKAKAIIHGWYPGALGGLAVAQLLRGEYSPSGKLPLTFYDEDNTIPDISDYSMKGRTYRYAEQKPLFPFGFGLSYTSFEYADFKVTENNADKLTVQVNVKNTGAYDGLEKVQLYAHYDDSRTTTPIYQLCGIKPVELNKGEEKTVTIEVDKYWIKAVLEDGTRVEPDGKITLYIGGHQPDERSYELCGTSCLSIELN
ncbi:MAG: glycoside hydrolase family 3 C-terminal domain-containing protein [Clostridia bacterium]|nr:glycoside hydrolase family 3 C-terminal domain-containing protein [Clostridia bacterium]